MNENINAVRTICKDGATSEEIARELGLDINVVRLICHAQKDVKKVEIDGRLVWKIKR